MNTNSQVLNIMGDRALEKSKTPLIRIFLLAILGGSFIALGGLAFIRITGALPQEWGGLSNFLGGIVFPVGLIGIVFVGGELLTGNMMVMMIGVLQKKISLSQAWVNWLFVFLGNLVGGLIVAYFFGHFIGLTEGAFLAKTLAVGSAKINDPFIVMIVSGIGCNIFVCMAVWMGSIPKDFLGKIFALWFPVMIFVLLGFQHVVANMFFIPIAMFSGESSISILQFALNMLFVFIGNLIGGAGCVAIPCYFNYRQKVPFEEIVGEEIDL